jgi:hypothetical protein
MDRIYYAGDAFYTGTAIAAGLLAYARVLAENDTSDTVDVPTRDGDGSIHRTRFLIGPASQLVSEEYLTTDTEITDDGLIRDMQSRADRLGRASAVPIDSSAPFYSEGLGEFEL